jgi:hypothetical protein
MTREDIMKLAKESYERGQSDLMESCKEAAIKAIESAILAEREACAKLCEEHGQKRVVLEHQYISKQCAAAIRARGQE